MFDLVYISCHKDNVKHIILFKHPSEVCALEIYHLFYFAIVYVDSCAVYTNNQHITGFMKPVL